MTVEFIGYVGHLNSSGTVRRTSVPGIDPGFIAPTLAARQLATLDQFSGGRVAVHVIAGGNDTEPAAATRPRGRGSEHAVHKQRKTISLSFCRIPAE